jgi:signal transduction histidine kinase
VLKNNYALKRLLLNNSYLLAITACLITISFIIDNYWSGTSSAAVVKKNITTYILQQENDFEELSKDTILINKLAAKNYDEQTLKELAAKKYFVFVYALNDSGLYKISFWNNHLVEPDAHLLTQPANTGFVLLSNGYYVWKKKRLNNIIFLALIPVKWNYTITNDYLKNSFTIGDKLDKNFDLSDLRGPFSIHSKEGYFLFSIQQKANASNTYNNLAGVILRILGGMLVLLFIQIVAIHYVHQQFYKGIFFLATALGVLRLASYYFPIPANFRQFELFDPAIYATNSMLRSLGDLLINATLNLWLVLFIRHYMQEKGIVLPIKNNWQKWLIILSGICIILIITVINGKIIRSLVADSQISFDVVNFFTLNIYSVIGFVVLGCLAIAFFLSTQIIIYLLQPLLPKNISALLLLVTIVGLTGLTISINQPGIIFELYLLVWLLAYLKLLSTPYFYFFTSRIVSSRLIFWLFFFSISICIIIISENKVKEIEKRKNFAEALAYKADPSSERLMNTVLTDFRNEVLAPLFQDFKSEATNRSIKDSLLNENFTGYLNKFDTRIFTFDEKEQALYNQDSTTYNTLNTILKTQGKPTAIKDLLYFDVSYDKFTYISKKDVIDTAGKLLGYMFLLASPKKYKTDALYPELFLKGYNNSIDNSPIYSFAVFNKLQLVTSHNDYAFPSHLSAMQVPIIDFETHTKDGYDELWYRAGTDKVVIIAKQNNLFIESITLFSYLFCAFLFVSFFFWFLNSFIRSRFRLSKIKQYWQMSIRNQVHSTIIFISLLSFIVVGLATILFFIDRYYSNNRERLSQTIHVLQNEIRNSISDLTTFDDVIQFYDAAYKEKLDKTIIKISELHSVDINIYDLNGNLKASSLSLPYNKGIISNLMDPEAYYHLHQLKEIQFFKNETIGTLQYLSNYVPIVDESGKEYAYLNIPYFTSQTKLRQEIASFLVAIINLNAFIFLIAGVVALFITNRITRSFSFISNKMKQINLGKINEEIVWKRKDEIGELVIEYNKMVAKLDEGAITLAKSEREMAWREMARQVAHEIKNPLTPMKLSLQYLQKAIENNADNVKELTKSVARTIVEQIDHLSQIAGEFSQFANIGNPKNEIFDLNESIKLITSLHSSGDIMTISWQPSATKIMIFADKTHINRLFTNLLQNAIQAIPENKHGEIAVKESVSGSIVLLTITDNGNGIPISMQSKIFTPNFTTKTSGTGLGLAMCKGIVEQSKGRIWFETEEGAGTVFYVELPLAGN